MQLFLIYIDENQTFNPEKVKNDLAKIKGVENINGQELQDSIIACDYRFGNSGVIARLDEDLKAISANGVSDASLNLALELQKHETRPLRITDDNYNFNFSIKEISSLDELKDKTLNNYFDEEALAMEATTN